MLYCKSRRLDKAFMRKKELENNFGPERGLKWEKVEAKRVLEMQYNTETKIGISKRRKRDFRYGPQ